MGLDMEQAFVHPVVERLFRSGGPAPDTGRRCPGRRLRRRLSHLLGRLSTWLQSSTSTPANTSIGFRPTLARRSASSRADDPGSTLDACGDLRRPGPTWCGVSSQRRSPWSWCCARSRPWRSPVGQCSVLSTACRRPLVASTSSAPVTPPGPSPVGMRLGWTVATPSTISSHSTVRGCCVRASNCRSLRPSVDRRSTVHVGPLEETDVTAWRASIDAVPPRLGGTVSGRRTR